MAEWGSKEKENPAVRFMRVFTTKGRMMHFEFKLKHQV